MPMPKVNSAVVRVALYREKPCRPEDEKLFFRVIKGSFGQRRKTLSNALTSAFPELDKQEVTDIIVSAGLSPQLRGEVLSVEQFTALSDAVYEALQNRRA